MDIAGRQRLITGLLGIDAPIAAGGMQYRDTMTWGH